MPNAIVQIIHFDTTCIMDTRNERVRILVNNAGKVIHAPKTG